MLIFITGFIGVIGKKDEKCDIGIRKWRILKSPLYSNHHIANSFSFSPTVFDQEEKWRGREMFWVLPITPHQKQLSTAGGDCEPDLWGQLPLTSMNFKSFILKSQNCSCKVSTHVQWRLRNTRYAHCLRALMGPMHGSVFIILISSRVDHRHIDVVYNIWFAARIGNHNCHVTQAYTV